MEKHECPCAYEYDPKHGDPANNIPAGTPFEDLPDNWVCPKCDSEKDFFEKTE